jgi:ABC-type sugar transport system permease subunit
VSSEADAAQGRRASPAARRVRWNERLTRSALILPSFVFLVVVFGYPLVRLGYVSLHTGSFGNQGPATLDNYRFVVDDPVFRSAVQHNLGLLLAVPVSTLTALALALVLNSGIRGWTVYRSVVFMPYMVSIPVLGLSFLLLLGRHGVINSLLGHIGLGNTDWFGNPNLALGSIGSMVVYHEIGFGVVLFLARLLTLSPEVFEAARIDGCGWLRVQRSIAIPQMRSIIVTYVTLQLITMLSSVFAYVYSTTKGGPDFHSYVLELYIFDSAFAFGSPAFAAAVAVLLLAPTALVIALWLRRAPIEVNVE